VRSPAKPPANHIQAVSASENLPAAREIRRVWTISSSTSSIRTSSNAASAVLAEVRQIQIHLLAQDKAIQQILKQLAAR
jgi:hypothetical protein